MRQIFRYRIRDLFLSSTLSLSFFLFCIMNQNLLACEDPCPSTALGQQFLKQAQQEWAMAESENAPRWSGVASYHHSSESAHYIAMVAQSQNVLVGEANCQLQQATWKKLFWQEVGADEFKKVQQIEQYSQGMPPLEGLLKAVYSPQLAIYLLKIKYAGQEMWIFKLYRHSQELGPLESLVGAFAHLSSH